MSITILDLEDISHIHKSAAEAVAYAIDSLKSASPRYSVRKASRAYFKMRRDMPYFIQETEIPKTCILVNRSYKPLGSNLPMEGDLVKYEDFKTLHIRLAPDQIASVASPACVRNLYEGGNSPWRGKKAAQDYLARLERLHQILIHGLT